MLLFEEIKICQSQTLKSDGCNTCSVYDLTFLYAHEVASTAENSIKDAAKKKKKQT